jgi:hypothetical protein
MYGWCCDSRGLNLSADIGSKFSRDIVVQIVLLYATGFLEDQAD